MMARTPNNSFLISSLSESGAKTLRKTYERCGYVFIAAERDGNTIIQEFKEKHDK